MSEPRCPICGVDEKYAVSGSCAKCHPPGRRLSASVPSIDPRDATIASLREKVEGLEKDNTDLRHDIERYVSISSEEATRATAAESLVAQLRAEGERKDAALKAGAAYVELYHVSCERKRATELAATMRATLTNGGTDAG